MITKRIPIPEYGHIPYQKIGPKLLSRLEAFDRSFAKKNEGCTIFDWSNRDYVRAQSYVGVVKVPGLSVEILPKIDADSDPDKLAQQNLLFMLSFAGELPIEERGLADLELRRMTLLDALLWLFVQKLFEELKRGLDRAYLTREENSPFIKGKLLFSEDLKRNIVRKDRSYISYDKFIEDTWLNRIFKATCRKLLSLASGTATQKRLREALFALDDVSDVSIVKHHFANVHLNRNSERFRVLIDFCKMVLCDQAPASAAGSEQTFSLLFPMDKLFEKFIAGFICKYGGIPREKIRAQSAGSLKWLLSRDSNDGNKGKGVFRLKPDIIINNAENTSKLIIDTKWKFLKSDEEDKKNGVLQSDIYQLYAYATRYKCPDNVLLFPEVRGVTGKKYAVPDDDLSPKLRVEFINMNLNLMKERRKFADKLKEILGQIGDKGEE